MSCGIKFLHDLFLLKFSIFFSERFSTLILPWETLGTDDFIDLDTDYIVERMAQKDVLITIYSDSYHKEWDCFKTNFQYTHLRLSNHSEVLDVALVG